MMDNLIDLAEKYVFETMKQRLPQAMIYHNYRHTVEVVQFCNELISVTTDKNINEEAIIIAAWFHDLGFVKEPEDHEKHSALMAKSFLEHHRYPKDKIDLVKSLILATKLEHTPTDINEEIIKDADTAHIATKRFKKKSQLLRKELNLLGHDISKRKWLKLNLRFLTKQHRFYTKYAIENWDKIKNRNLLKLIKKREKNKAKGKQNKDKIKWKVAAKRDNPERGVQTMFRVTLRNHLKLSDIADTKANILLSVNAIIISLALANLIPKLDAPSNYHLWWPTLILVLFSVASIILSIRSTQPKVSGGEFSNDELHNRKVNLLFFGNFYKIGYDKYQSLIDELIKDKGYLYHQLTKDLYLLGLVLQKKYKLLNVTYIVFTIGIILSVLAFIVAFINMEIPEQIIEAAQASTS